MHEPPLHSARDDGIVVVEASTLTPAPVLTTNEYLQTPETLRPTELIFGALRAAEAPTAWHQQAVGAFHLALAPYVRRERLGRVYLSPIDVIFDHAHAVVLQPDLVFVSAARLGMVKDRIVGSPDLVLEVLSPNPRIGQLEERLALFARYGVREIWLLHQLRQTFEIVRTGGGRIAVTQQCDYDTPIVSAVLPGFTRTVGEILSDTE